MRLSRGALWIALVVCLGAALAAGWTTVSAVASAVGYRSRTGEGVAFAWTVLPFLGTFVALLAASLVGIGLSRPVTREGSNRPT
jgi:hypothetical protein